jgi:hypothetical protein
MPIAPPMNAIHIGRPAGSVRPSRIPVIAADPSPIEPLCPRARSASTAPATAALTTRSALGPKKYVAAATSGARLPTTFHMMTGVLTVPRTCGDAAMTSF